MATKNRALRKRWRFFQENAGYCAPPGRAACALALAKGEEWAIEHGADWTVEIDCEHWEGDCPEPPLVVNCCLALDGESVSLCGIGVAGWGDDYLRVVYAELALELQELLLERECNAIPRL